MEISQKLLDEICKEIETRNKELTIHSVVHSDTFVKFMSSSTGLPKDSIKFALRVLQDAHKIFAIEIVADDERRKIDQVEGYVCCDLPIVRNLKSYFDEHLIKAYEAQFHKRAGSAQIKKELFPMVRNLNNTEMGQILNKAIMLNEYERLLEKEWQQFSPEYQEQKLAEFALKHGFKYQPKVPVKLVHEEINPFNMDVASEDEPAQTQRAVDSPEYNDFSDKMGKYPLQRILNIYGLDFFLKVQFRKYNFPMVRKIIEDKQISKKKDLMMIREMIGKIKDSMFSGKDPLLNEHKEEIYALERAISHAIYFSV